MKFLLAMLPIYLLGNLHCLGMCGPLVAMLGTHRFRNFYFLGRTLSFSLTAMIAGGVGALLHGTLQKFHISALFSIGLGGAILWMGSSFLRMKPLIPSGIERWLEPINRRLSLYILKDQPLPVFLFGFFTVALPCGQTVLVFSACALSADAWIGLVNGFAFALLTSPSLFFALQLHKLLSKIKNSYNFFLGISAIAIGVLAICRGFADLDLINHWVINQNFHIVMY